MHFFCVNSKAQSFDKPVGGVVSFAPVVAESGKPLGAQAQHQPGLPRIDGSRLPRQDRFNGLADPI
jgi:hypothetical protein